MKINIKLNGISPSVNELVEEELKNSGIPVCFGSMCPPFVLNEVLEEDTDFLGFSFNIEPEDKTDIHPSIITDSRDHLAEYRFAVKKSGIEKLNKIKMQKVKNYTDHLKRCAECTLVDTCFKLTTVYTENIKFLEKL